MDRRPAVMVSGLGLVLTALVAGCSTTTGTETFPATPAPVQTPMESRSSTPGTTDDMKMSKEPKVPAGGYVSLADYQRQPDTFANSDVVLFFNASWCPTCQEATEQLTGAQFPAGLTVVSVDYDSNEQLRDQYGVTTQHTFVVIDKDGQEIKKFTGATDVATIERNVA